MTARSGMTDIISTLRSMTNSGTADYTVNAVSFWSDDEMQRTLDRHRQDFYREELIPREEHTGASELEYTEYRTGYRNIESGTAYFAIEDAAGSAFGTALWSADYIGGIVTFTTDQEGSARFLSARAYNMEAAAADVWRLKMGHYADTRFDFSTDGHTINRSQLTKMAMDMVHFYESQGGADTVEIFA